MPIMTNHAHNFIDISGHRFGRLLVLGRTADVKRTRWVCACDCGVEKVVAKGDLQSGRTQSCGCLAREMNEQRRDASLRQKHRREYNSWAGMRQRCRDPNHIEFNRYGGRGISVCERWNDSFENFLHDMGERPVGTSIERDDNSADYSPENCRWATKAEQSSNTSRSVLVDFDGRQWTLKQLAQHLGVSYDRLHTHHRDRGLSIEDAVAKTLAPVRGRWAKRA